MKNLDEIVLKSGSNAIKRGRLTFWKVKLNQVVGIATALTNGSF